MLLAKLVRELDVPYVRTSTKTSLPVQIRRCLRNKQWDTRIAASTCLGRMAAHFQHHTASSLAQQAESKPLNMQVKLEGSEASAGSMTFGNFDISQVLQQGTVLLASAGQVGVMTCMTVMHCRSV